MISRLSGELLSVRGGVAEVRLDGLVYELLIPAADEPRLSDEIGAVVTLHTLHYLEGQGQGSSYWPRLIGFRTPEDRDFFELFTTVKGIGNRRALRALQMPFARVAAAIAGRDLALLTSLPEVGRKTAETIVVELKGRVDRFAMDHGMGTSLGGATGGAAGGAAPAGGAGFNRLVSTPVNDAIAVMIQLGESRAIATALVESALAREPELASAESLVAAALRRRETAS